MTKVEWMRRFGNNLRTENQWIEVIKQVPNEVRNIVARIIWWDYAAEKTFSERWGMFDEFLQPPYLEAKDEDVVNGLIICGYTEEKATRRVCK